MKYAGFRLVWAERIGIFVITLLILAGADFLYQINPWLAGVFLALVWTYITEE